MNIALIKKRYSLRAGGSERYCVNMARRLQTLGHRVTVIGEAIDDELSGEVPFLKVNTNRLTSWTHNRSFAVNAGRIAQAGDYDIVYGLGRALGVNVVRVTERLQSHWLNVRYHGVVRSLQRWNPRHRTLIDLERTIYESPATRRIVTQSQFDRELVQRFYDVPSTKIRTIYNGVDTSIFNVDARNARTDVRQEWNIPQQMPLMIFASMDFEGKGLRAILRAIAYAETEVRLLVLGEGPIRRFRRLADQLDIAEQITFAGRQSGIERFFGAADLSILPTAYEPFPNVNLESMACGTPVITTTTSGSVDIVEEGETGYFVSGMNAAEQMAALIDRHFKLDSTRREAMSVRCQETAKSRTIQKHVQQTVALFNEVLGESHPLRNVG